MYFVLYKPWKSHTLFIIKKKNGPIEIAAIKVYIPTYIDIIIIKQFKYL